VTETRLLFGIEKDKAVEQAVPMIFFSSEFARRMQIAQRV